MSVITKLWLWCHELDYEYFYHVKDGYVYVVEEYSFEGSPVNSHLIGIGRAL